jgi:hypothetical protein
MRAKFPAECGVAQASFPHLVAGEKEEEEEEELEQEPDP